MTTIDILAPYLPFGIEVEDNNGQAFELIGLNNANSHGERKQLAEVWAKGESHAFTIRRCENLTPVLFAFEDLCTPLADGTVPAIEIAKLMIPEVEVVEGEVRKGRNEQYFYCVGTNRLDYFGISESSFRRGSIAGNLCDLLRRLRFAVGLTPEQFIRKTV